jgi:hypothetical protein
VTFARLCFLSSRSRTSRKTIASTTILKHSRMSRCFCESQTRSIGSIWISRVATLTSIPRKSSSPP